MEADFEAAIREKYKDRKICIAWPSPEKVDYRFYHDMFQLSTRTAHYMCVAMANQVSCRVAVNRNGLVQQARLQGATDILWVDADSKFPMNGILRLLSFDKDIVCATTARRQSNDTRGVGAPLDVNNGAGVQKLWPMKWVGMPFMLTKMSVFDKLDDLLIAESNGILKKGDIPYFAEPPRWMCPEIDTNVENLVAEDEYFCWYARKAGFDIWCDEELSMELGHIGSTIYYIQAMDTNAASPAVDIEFETRNEDSLGE